MNVKSTTVSAVLILLLSCGVHSDVGAEEDGTTVEPQTTTEAPSKFVKVVTPQSLDPDYQNVGVLITDNRYTWRVMIKFENSKNSTGKPLYCGGAILSRRTVVTTASCLFDKTSADKYDKASLFAGQVVFDPNNAEPVTEYLLPGQVIIHPKFNYSDGLHDNLALLVSLRDIPLSNSIGAIEIDDIPNSLSSADMRLMGFGRFNDGSPVSQARFHYVRFLSQNRCANVYGPDVCSNNSLSSIGKYTALANICRVESGAPVSRHYTWLLKPKLIAIASFVSEYGCRGNLPDGYVYLWNYLDWIKSYL